MPVNEFNEPIQDEPIQDGPHASDDAKVKGIVEQVRADAGMGHTDDLRNVLSERLSQAGLTVGDEELENLVTQVSGG